MRADQMQLIAQDFRKAVSTDTFDCEARFSAVSDDGMLEGMAVRFGVIDNYRTEFTPDAFKEAEGRQIPMLWSHDPAQVIGSWSALQVRADGLVAKGKLNLAVARAQEIRALLQAGDVRGLSIGFRTKKDERLSSGVRRIVDAHLVEISVVAFPAVPGSAVTSVRNADLTSFTRAVMGAANSLRRKEKP